MSTPKEKKERALRRFFDIFPPLISWSLLTSPIWAGFFAPFAAAYFIIFFDIYFFYRASALGINSVRGYLKIRQNNKIDWFKKLKAGKLPWRKLNHIVMIPTYKEPKEILTRTLTFLSEQEFPTKQIHICIATEKREEGAIEKARQLQAQFGHHFANFWITAHPLAKGEISGKSSNLAYAAKQVKKIIGGSELDKDFVTVTSCDADVSLHPKYFSNLTFKFLTDPEKYLHFWQGALVFYNNIWRVPVFVRVVHTIYSINNIAEIMRPGSNFNFSTYSLSWRLLDRSGFWDSDVVAEDWHLFFKAFFAHKGLVSLESIYLPLYADAVEGNSYMESLKAQYDQNRRWAWGVTDISYVITQFLKHRKKISLSNFIFRFVKAAEQHVLWPVNWWIITIGAVLPPLLNPAFRYTTLGFYLPKIAGLILTSAIIFFLSIIIVDFLMKPPRPDHFKKSLLPLTVIQYILLPITGFIFSSLPGMDAHTRLLLGKRLEYKVTEKIVK